MKTYNMTERTTMAYNFFNKQGLLTIAAGIAVTVGVLLLERKSYMDGNEHAIEIMEEVLGIS